VNAGVGLPKVAVEVAVLGAPKLKAGGVGLGLVAVVVGSDDPKTNGFTDSVVGVGDGVPKEKARGFDGSVVADVDPKEKVDAGVDAEAVVEPKVKAGLTSESLGAAGVSSFFTEGTGIPNEKTGLAVSVTGAVAVEVAVGTPKLKLNLGPSFSSFTSGLTSEEEAASLALILVVPKENNVAVEAVVEAAGSSFLLPTENENGSFASSTLPGEPPYVKVAVFVE